MEDKYRDRVAYNVDYERDVKPYKLTWLISGVGSGKNYWSENDLMEDKRVLLITSRKAKVEERVEQVKLDKCLRISHLEERELADSITANKISQSCICSNSQIEWYMKNVFVKDYEQSHLWRFFDVIILDEAHSLATDATYSDAPFYVLDFLKATYQMTDLPIVLMTATPKPVTGLIPVADKSKVNYLDLRKKCRNIKPKHIALSTCDGCIESIITNYNKDEFGNHKIIYFVNHVKTMYDVLIPRLIEAGIPEEIIAVSYSVKYDTNDNTVTDDRDSNFSETILRNKMITEEYLKTHEDLPDNIKIFITTSKNKEGINIDNDKYKWVMYAESHWDDELMQMYGRVRTGVDWLYIAFDATQHVTSYPEYELDYYMSKATVKSVNKAFDAWCNVKEFPLENRYMNSDTRKKITEVLNKFQYLNYSTYEDKFVFYTGRKFGKENCILSLREFEILIDDIMNYGHSEIDYFWGMPFYYYEHEFMPVNMLFEKYLEEKGIAEGSVITKEKRDDLLVVANKLLKKKYTSHNSAFKNLGYKAEQCSKHKDAPEYGMFLVKRI